VTGVQTCALPISARTEGECLRKGNVRAIDRWYRDRLAQTWAPWPRVRTHNAYRYPYTYADARNIVAAAIKRCILYVTRFTTVARYRSSRVTYKIHRKNIPGGMRSVYPGGTGRPIPAAKLENHSQSASRKRRRECLQYAHPEPPPLKPVRHCRAAVPS